MFADPASIDGQLLRGHIYGSVLERGLPPKVHEIGTHFGVSPDAARQALARLKIGKTVLVHPRTGEIWMAGPFAARETPYRVTGSKTRWFANCAWDMIGVTMIANEPVRIETSCTDCGTPMTLDVEPGRKPLDSSVVHFLVPAQHWYDDIEFT